MGLVRTTVPIAAVLLTAALAAADRQWQTGRWTDAGIKRDLWVADPSGRGAPFGPKPVSPQRAEVATYVIETETQRFQVQEMVPVGMGLTDVSVGAPVTFAVEKHTVYVRMPGGDELKLRLIKKTTLPRASGGVSQRVEGYFATPMIPIQRVSLGGDPSCRSSSASPR